MKIDFKNIQEYFDEHSRCFSEFDTRELDTLVARLLNCWSRDGILWLFGNGGSASTASHASCDLSKGLFERGRPARSLSLVDMIPSLTAWSNDDSYLNSFLDLGKNFVRSNDHVMLISGSGNSENLNRLADWCIDNKIECSFLVGMDGGKLAKTVPQGIHIRSQDMQVIENMHLTIIHWILRRVGDNL